MITDLGYFANFINKNRSFLTKQPGGYGVSLRVWLSGSLNVLFLLWEAVWSSRLLIPHPYVLPK